MDIKAYINSGTLELYVLDKLPPDERREVEMYARENPEIREEIDRIEVSLENYSLLLGQSTRPAPDVLQQVLSLLAATGTTPPPPPPKDKVTPVDNTAKGGAGAWVAIILAALFLAAAAYFYGTLNKERARYQELESTMQTLREDCDALEEARTQQSQLLANLTSPATDNIVLDGTDNAPNSQAVVFYNSEKQHALFSAANLPTPPSGKQYQLWAIDADGPKSLGVLDLDLDPEELLEVDYLPAVATFAVTLEDAGGKPQPDLSALQVIGDVKS